MMNGHLRRTWPPRDDRPRASFETDQRGAVYVEMLVAFLPVFFFFFGLLQATDLFAAKLIVRRAAAAAVRAAIVVLPDDGRYYGDSGNRLIHQFDGLRRIDVERAAKIVLSASRHLRPGLGEAVVGVTGNPSGHQLITVEVMARYTCFTAPLGYACGLDRSVVLSARASLPYQGADYEYR